MEIKPIAVIHTDFPEKFGIPRQSGLVPSLMGRLEFYPEYRTKDAVRGIEGYSHLWILWQFSKSLRENWSATVAPPRLGGRQKMGVFATRSPFRPNPIGLSCVKLESVQYDEINGPVLYVSGIDMLDGTPVYDIKPYIPYADSKPDATGGFSDDVKENNLSVCIPDELKMKIQEQDYETIKTLLAQDPRTAYIHDKSRVWGMSYKDINIRFIVDGDLLKVLEITQIP